MINILSECLDGDPDDAKVVYLLKGRTLLTLPRPLSSSSYHLRRVARGYEITAVLHKSLLSRKTPTRQLTLHVFGPTRGMPTSTAIDLELHHGPTLNCPEQQRLAAPVRHPFALREHKALL